MPIRVLRAIHAILYVKAIRASWLDYITVIENTLFDEDAGQNTIIVGDDITTPYHYYDMSDILAGTYAIGFIAGYALLRWSRYHHHHPPPTRPTTVGRGGVGWGVGRRTSNPQVLQA